jgi:hypothetical protein
VSEAAVDDDLDTGGPKFNRERTFFGQDDENAVLVTGQT